MSGALKARWTSTEDELLVSKVLANRNAADGEVDWHAVSGALHDRTAKQCRERWTGSLNPDLNRGPWTDAEVARMFQLVEKHGTSWKTIAKDLGTGRSELMIRNLWYARQRKDAKTGGSGTPSSAARRTPTASSAASSAPAANGEAAGAGTESAVSAPAAGAGAGSGSGPLSAAIGGQRRKRKASSVSEAITLPGIAGLAGLSPLSMSFLSPSGVMPAPLSGGLGISAHSGLSAGLVSLQASLNVDHGMELPPLPSLSALLNPSSSASAPAPAPAPTLTTTTSSSHADEPPRKKARTASTVEPQGVLVGGGAAAGAGAGAAMNVDPLSPAGSATPSSALKRKSSFASPKASPTGAGVSPGGGAMRVGAEAGAAVMTSSGGWSPSGSAIGISPGEPGRLSSSPPTTDALDLSTGASSMLQGGLNKTTPTATGAAAVAAAAVAASAARRKASNAGPASPHAMNAASSTAAGSPPSSAGGVGSAGAGAGGLTGLGGMAGITPVPTIGLAAPLGSPLTTGGQASPPNPNGTSSHLSPPPPSSLPAPASSQLYMAGGPLGMRMALGLQPLPGYVKPSSAVPFPVPGATTTIGGRDDDDDEDEEEDEAAGQEEGDETGLSLLMTLGAQRAASEAAAAKQAAAKHAAPAPAPSS